MANIADNLRKPFPPTMIKWKAQAVSKDKTSCLAVAYVDARIVMERLDQVCGADNWQDSYEVLEGGSVLCAISIRMNGEWIRKCDVGSPSEQPDDGDKLKAAFSDGFKRAAVKFGIARYLYWLPSSWVPYDERARKPKTTPPLPDWATPDELPEALDEMKAVATDDTKTIDDLKTAFDAGCRRVRKAQLPILEARKDQYKKLITARIAQQEAMKGKKNEPATQA